MCVDKPFPCCVCVALQEGWEFSEGTSFKLIVDVEIETLRAEILFHVEMT